MSRHINTDRQTGHKCMCWAGFSKVERGPCPCHYFFLKTSLKVKHQYQFKCVFVSFDAAPQNSGHSSDGTAAIQIVLEKFYKTIWHLSFKAAVISKNNDTLTMATAATDTIVRLWDIRWQVLWSTYSLENELKELKLNNGHIILWIL